MGDDSDADGAVPADRAFGRAAVAGLLAAFATPPLLLGLDPGVTPSWLVPTVAMLVPLTAATLVLGRLAHRVASRPDDPSLVDPQVADATGVTSEEYEDLLE